MRYKVIKTIKCDENHDPPGFIYFRSTDINYAYSALITYNDWYIRSQKCTCRANVEEENDV